MLIRPHRLGRGHAQGHQLLLLPDEAAGASKCGPCAEITNGESHFNEVFITDAIVPEENLLGPLNAGWGVLQTALAYERSVMGDGGRADRAAASPNRPTRSR